MFLFVQRKFQPTHHIWMEVRPLLDVRFHFVNVGDVLGMLVLVLNVVEQRTLGVLHQVPVHQLLAELLQKNRSMVYSLWFNRMSNSYKKYKTIFY